MHRKSAPQEFKDPHSGRGTTLHLISCFGSCFLFVVSFRSTSDSQATASIDPQTDELIQRTIRSSFAHCTVLTIAHRLHTIIDSDRILVLEKGKLVELETPAKLLRDPNSLFAKLVKETGAEESSKLRKLAAKRFGIDFNSNGKEDAILLRDGPSKRKSRKKRNPKVTETIKDE